MLSTSIEFVGKCWNGKNDWFARKEKEDYDEGLTRLGEKYHEFKSGEISDNEKSDHLRKHLRNGFSHALKPMNKIRLSDKKSNPKNIPHLDIVDGSVFLVAEVLRDDIVKALKDILAFDFSGNPCCGKSSEG
ncbi:MAG: hypothetical protein NW226_25300 [Microscillaceae bacterium]|nr:hypothetical protein [Microscillaceae bacterium]